MNIKLKVGGRIRELRKKAGFSQETLANKSGVDRTYMTDVENGRRNVSVEILERIILGLEVSVAQFFSAEIFEA